MRTVRLRLPRCALVCAVLFVLAVGGPSCGSGGASDGTTGDQTQDASLGDAGDVGIGPVDSVVPLDAGVAPDVDVASGGPPDTPGDHGGEAVADAVDGDAGEGAGPDADAAPDADMGPDAGDEPEGCFSALGSPAPDGHQWIDGDELATASVDDASSCVRTYTVATTQALVDDLPQNPRVVAEGADQPVLRTGHLLFDALYALAIQEVRDNSVDAISDGAFGGGVALPCPPGGCFETGRKWTYVWTRDTAYAVRLGLAQLDPVRAMNSLDFKLSERRSGGDLQIVQDTGSGGSYPISSDRVVWAMGAWEVLKFLPEPERTTFRDRAYEALRNTADHDRAVVFDAEDGLYTGEQSFLDWREQSYPAFTAEDTVHIGMSKALGTNVGHLRLLEVTAALAEEQGLTDDAATYDAQADALRAAIAARFWLPEDGAFSTFVPSTLDPAPVRRVDLLASALAVLAGVGDPAQRAQAVASYPHLSRGAPVFWPQQQFTPIYHNRGIWPFVTAFWIAAAREVGHAAAVDHGVRSLVRGAALNLSNMENFEAATGLPWKGDEGQYSGPVINSQRQLWSVAGYVAMVQQVLFGFEATQGGLRVAPFVPAALRADLFGGMERLALSGLPYHEGRLAIRLHLDPDEEPTAGALVAVETHLNGVPIGPDPVPAESLTGDDVFDVWLGPAPGTDGSLTALSDAEVSDYQQVFGPRTPSISSITLEDGLLRVSVDLDGETPGDVTFDVYRDGERVAEGLPGTTPSWLDPGSSAQGSTSFCYTVETRFGSGTRSQHAKPVCWWGEAWERVQVVDAQALVADGGELVFGHGEWHHQDWGAAADQLMASGVVATWSGPHMIQLRAGNGSGPVNTGVTCAIKRVAVYVAGTDELVGSGYAMMPHLGTWDAWADSSFVPVTLEAGQAYDIVVDEDDLAINMSERDHFATYSGAGGSTGRHNFVNISQVKLLALASEGP